MKKTIFLLFLPLWMFAQQPVSDTVYIENRNGQFFRVLQETFDNGECITRETPLGSDTAAVISAIISGPYQQAEQFARSAVIVSYLPRIRQSITVASSTLTAFAGTSYFSVLERSEIGEGLLGTYTMNVAGANVSGSIIRIANNALRYRQGSTNFVLDVVARNWIRIRRYDGSNTQTADTSVVVDLYMDEQRGVWTSLDRRFTMKKQ